MQKNEIKNTGERALFTKFRISAHSLEIEQGRSRNIPAEARLCSHCDLNKVETEIHFLVECPTFIKNALEIFVKTIVNYLMKINLPGLCRTKLP
jgi:hypothetical protein